MAFQKINECATVTHIILLTRHHPLQDSNSLLSYTYRHSGETQHRNCNPYSSCSRRWILPVAVPLLAALPTTHPQSLHHHQSQSWEFSSRRLPYPNPRGIGTRRMMMPHRSASPSPHDTDSCRRHDGHPINRRTVPAGARGTPPGGGRSIFSSASHLDSWGWWW